jgi:phosphoribosylformylglycinamidine (FGAM) synthase-like enzyme
LILKKPKYLISDIEYFFSEDQGRYLIEVTKKDLKKVTNVLDKNAVHYDELGVINEDQLYINEKSKITIDELKSSNTSWLNNYMDN